MPGRPYEQQQQPLRIAVAWKPFAKFPMAARLGAEQRRAVERTIETLQQLGHTIVDQLAGKPYEEGILLRLATQLESTRPWAGFRPPTM